MAVLQGKHLIHGGRLLYSAVEKVTSPAMFEIRGPGRRARLLSGLIPPAWTDRSFAYIHGLQGKLTCCDPAKIPGAAARKDPPPKPGDRPRRRLPTWAATKIRQPDQRWSAPRVTGTSAISLAVAANAVLAVCQPPPPGPVPARPARAVMDRPTIRANTPVKAVAAGGGRPKWILVALGDGAGRRLWHEPLGSRPLPGGLIVDRSGQTIVACQNGELVCFGKPAGE